MPSPFPGMDPYLEDPAFWRDFHGEFIYACRDEIFKGLPDGYEAAVDEQVRLIDLPPEEFESAKIKDVLPDVAVLRTPSRQSAAAGPATSTGAALLEPVTIQVPAEQEVRERWIEIRYRPDHSLVTVVEVLSPTNKNVDGWGEYRAKRKALQRQKVNLLEIDLLVGGRRVEPAEQLPAGDYYAVLSPADRPGVRDVYAWPVRRPLPTVPVPLRPMDGTVSLNLAAAFIAAYDRGRYARRVRYQGPPSAPLTETDIKWAADITRAAR
jgi:hypothetical protein